MNVPKDLDPNQPKRDWKRFQRISLDRKNLSQRMRRAETSSTKHAHKFIVKRIDSLRQSRQSIILWLVGVGTILVGVTLQIIWSQNIVMTEAPMEGGTYAEGVVGSLDSLNPLFASSSAEVSASHLLFSSLYSYDPSGSLHSDLAISAQPNKKGNEYLVKLRQDVKWHDGELLTAEDVAYTINLIKDPEARVRSSLRANWQDVEVKTIDTYSLLFKLPAPYAAFAHAMTFPVVPEHILARTPISALREAPFSRSPIGSGPFVARLLQTADATSGRKVVHMVKNHNYYAETPLLNRFELYTYDSSDSLLTALRGGEITAAANISSTQIDQLDKTKFNVKSVPIDNGVYALFNNSHPILKDSKVRRALRLAIDTDKIRQAIGGQFNELDLPFLHSQVKGDNVPRAPKQSSAQAIKQLTEAGWKRGDKFLEKDSEVLNLTIKVTKNPQYEKVASIIRDQLISVGVDARLEIIDDKSPTANFIQDVLQARNYDVLIYELPIGADPDVYAYWHSSQLGVSGYNFANYSNKSADAALASARDRLDPVLRNAKYIDFAERWLSDAPAVGLYQQSLTYVRNNSAAAIGDRAHFVSATDRYANIAHWSVDEQRVYKTP